jgi:hypothetical protein
MPPNDEIIAARINLRIAELRVIAAETFIACHARGLLGVALPGGTDAPWTHALDRNALSPRRSRSGGGGLGFIDIP